MKTTIYKTDGTMLVREWEEGEYPDLAWLRRAIGGGYVNIVFVGDLQVYFDEDGEGKRMPANLPAAKLLGDIPSARGGVLLGPVVVLDGFPHPNDPGRMVDPGTDDMGMSSVSKSLDTMCRDIAPSHIAAQVPPDGGMLRTPWCHLPKGHVGPHVCGWMRWKSDMGVQPVAPATGMRQKVVYFPYRNRVGKEAPPIEVEEKPDRVWTLFDGHQKPDEPPVLPIVPVHNRNAFLEDEIHDWTWWDGKLKYGSRVAEGEVWLLLEYKEKTDVSDASPSEG